jgi:hypothetical protein
VPHVLIQLTMRPGELPAPRQDPRRYARLIGVIAQRTGGHVKGCWFTGDGEQILAVLSIDGEIESDAMRSEVEQILPGVEATVTTLLTLREILGEAHDERAGIEPGTLIDPVDLASDLSFPASDPPTWFKHTKGTSEGSPPHTG